MVFEIGIPLVMSVNKESSVIASFLKTSFLSVFLTVGVCNAQTTFTVSLGDKASIPLKIDTSSTCNVEVLLAGKREQMTVEPTSPQLLIAFEGKELGVYDLKWEGKFRPRGLKSVAACEGSGTVKVSVVQSIEQRRSEWVSFFAGLRSESSRQCVKVGLHQKGLLFESIDPQARLESPSSPAAREVFTKCDSFLSARTPWGAQDKENFSCTVGGIATHCRGVYAERMPDGKLRPISFDDALRLHFDGRSWTTGQLETAQGKAAREEQERVAAERRESQIAANKEAEEKARIAKAEADDRERKWKDSPEYKKQQADLERQKAAESKAAEIRAKKEQEAAQLAIKKLQKTIFDRKWSLDNLPCNLNGGAYVIYTNRAPSGEALTLAGKLNQSSQRQDFEFRMIDESTIEHSHVIYADGNPAVIKFVRDPNTVVSKKLSRIRMVSSNRLEYENTISTIDVDAMFNGNIRYQRKSESGYRLLCP